MNATTTPAIEQAEIERHPAGERWMGMEVAAWRTPVRKPADCPQDKWDGMFPTGAGNTYAEHWSTPGSHEWDEDKVERLFLQADVAALLARQRQAFEACEARLLEALERIAADAPATDPGPAYDDGWVSHGNYDDVAHDARQEVRWAHGRIARAALKDQPDSG